MNHKNCKQGKIIHDIHVLLQFYGVDGIENISLYGLNK